MNVPHAWKWPAVSDRIGQPSPTRHANGYDDYKSTSRKFLASKSGRERRTWAVKVIANSCLPLVEIWIIAGWMGWRLPFVSGWHRRATMEEWRIKKTMDPSLCVWSLSKWNEWIAILFRLLFSVVALISRLLVVIRARGSRFIAFTLFILVLSFLLGIVNCYYVEGALRQRPCLCWWTIVRAMKKDLS